MVFVESEFLNKSVTSSNTEFVDSVFIGGELDLGNLIWCIAYNKGFDIFIVTLEPDSRSVSTSTANQV